MIASSLTMIPLESLEWSSSCRVLNIFLSSIDSSVFGCDVNTQLTTKVGDLSHSELGLTTSLQCLRNPQAALMLPLCSCCTAYRFSLLNVIWEFCTVSLDPIHPLCSTFSQIHSLFPSYPILCFPTHQGQLPKYSLICGFPWEFDGPVMGSIFREN